MKNRLTVLVGIVVLVGLGCATTRPAPITSVPSPKADGIVFEKREGQVWVEGRYARVDNEWVWQPGSYVPARPGQIYRQGRWEESDEGWVWLAGKWEPVRDGQVWVRGRWVPGEKREWVWIQGGWQPTLYGYVWNPGYWVREGPRPRWQRGHWARVRTPTPEAPAAEDTADDDDGAADEPSEAIVDEQPDPPLPKKETP